MKTSKIKTVVSDGTYKGLNKSKVTFENGDSLTFFHKENFKKQVGETATYEITNEKYGVGKLQQDAPTTKLFDKSTNQSILRQVAFKGAIELVVANRISYDQIEQTTNEFFNILNK